MLQNGPPKIQPPELLPEPTESQTKQRQTSTMLKMKAGVQSWRHWLIEQVKKAAGMVLEAAAVPAWIPGA